MNGNGRDNARDRAIGAHWEDAFCELYWAHRGGLLVRNQKGRTDAAHAEALGRDGLRWICLMPDVQVLSGPGEHHEIKHKAPYQMRGWAPSYGLEVYRFEALVQFADEVKDPVLYTIHDWQMAGASASGEDMPNRLEDWVTVGILELAERNKRHRPKIFWCGSYRNGTYRPHEPTYFWPASVWTPIDVFWKHHQPGLWP
jgi:hypothetical protein